MIVLCGVSGSLMDHRSRKWEENKTMATTPMISFTDTAVAGGD